MNFSVGLHVISDHSSVLVLRQYVIGLRICTSSSVDGSLSIVVGEHRGFKFGGDVGHSKLVMWRNHALFRDGLSSVG